MSKSQKYKEERILFELTCSTCGFKQKIYLTPSELEKINRSPLLWCPRRSCKEQDRIGPVIRPLKGFRWFETSIFQGWSIFTIKPEVELDDSYLKAKGLLMAGLQRLSSNKEEVSPLFTTWGAQDGCCNHVHRSKLSAFRCLGYRRYVQQRRGLKTDREVRVIYSENEIHVFDPSKGIGKPFLTKDKK